MIDPGLGTRPVNPGAAHGCILLLALLLTALVIPAVVADPWFYGDAAHRMNLARFPVIRLDNRVWLPMLQTHIWLLYQFRPPLFVYKLIPCFYYFISVLLVGLIAFNNTGRTRASLAFALVLAFCFARQRLVLFLGMSLMQEIIGLALFLLLLQMGALQLRRTWWLFMAAACALITRDTFWIYLFVVSLLNWKKILSARSYVHTFIALWAVPALWLLMIPVGYWFTDGRLPEFPAEWPLGINKVGNQAVSDLHTAASSLWASLVDTRVVYFLAAVVLLWAALQVLRWLQPNRPIVADGLGTDFKPFSLISLGIIYSLFLLFDPFQATPGARRMSVPVLVHASVWAILLFSEASVRGVAMKYLAAGVICAGLIPSLNILSLPLPANDFTQVKRVYGQIEHDLNRLVPDESAPVCIVDQHYFSGLRLLLPPTFYRKRIMLLQTAHASLSNCAVVFVPEGSPSLPLAGFSEYRRYLVDGFAYRLFARR